MFVTGFASILVIIWSVGAAKDGGDDEWVHLPNKCEGKCVKYQPRLKKTVHKYSADLVKSELHCSFPVPYLCLIMRPLFTFSFH